MNDNTPGYDHHGGGLPWAFVAGAALGINEALNDRDVAAGYTPSWPRRHPFVYIALCWVGCALGLFTAAFVLYWYAMAGALLAHFYPGHDLQIGFLQIGIPVYFIGKWRYLLAEKRWNPTAHRGPGQWR